MKLADTEARFHALVTARDDVAAIAARDAAVRATIDAMVVGDDRLSAVERLDVYATCTSSASTTCCATSMRARRPCWAARRSTVWSPTTYKRARPRIRRCAKQGARLPAFVAAHALAADRPWLAELARLERARLEVFDGPDAPPLSIAALRGVAPEQFGALRLRLIPAHRLLDGRFTVSETWRADDPGATPPRAEPETLIVWRREVDVFHRPSDADEARWLARMADGEGVTFETLCSTLGETLPDEAAAARAFELCARWAGEGLLDRAAY